MRNRRPRDKRTMGGFDAQRYLRLLAIPVIVVILILVIVIVDRSPKSKEADVKGKTTEVTAEGDAQAGSDGQAETEPEEPFTLKKSEIPEINALMESYCRAKAECDAETMYELFGKTDTAGMEELREKMQWRAKYIESFQNITCYTMPGLDENSYLVYVSADIKFRVTDTLAPNLMWCYVTKNQDGKFIISENVSKDVLSYVAQAEQSEGVRLLAAQINARLEEAAASDTKLASAYGMLRKGAPAPGEETTAAMSLETTAADSSENAEDGAGSSEGEGSLEGGTSNEEGNGDGAAGTSAAESPASEGSQSAEQ